MLSTANSSYLVHRICRRQNTNNLSHLNKLLLNPSPSYSLHLLPSNELSRYSQMCCDGIHQHPLAKGMLHFNFPSFSLEKGMQHSPPWKRVRSTCNSLSPLEKCTLQSYLPLSLGERSDALVSSPPPRKCHPYPCLESNFNSTNGSALYILRASCPMHVMNVAILCSFISGCLRLARILYESQICQNSHYDWICFPSRLVALGAVSCSAI